MGIIATSLIPVMTSNTSPSGTVSASSTLTQSGSTYYPWLAFDGNTANSIANSWVSTQGANITNQWLQYEFSSPQVVNRYELFVRATASDLQWGIGSAPKTWRFEGYNDSTGVWDILDTQTNFPSSQWINNSGNIVFMIDNRTAYKKYRLYLLSFQYTGTSYYMIRELIMYNVITNKILVYHNGIYKSYINGNFTAITNSPTEEDYLNFGTDDITTVPENAWNQLSGEIEICYYTEDLNISEAQFNIQTTPFTLAEEWEDQTIKIIEYTDNPDQTESAITLETEDFSIYDEFGDTVDVLYYTDDPNKTSATLEIAANYSPLDEIEEDFEIVTWTDNADAENMVLKTAALPYEQVLVSEKSFPMYDKVNNIDFNKVAGMGTIKAVMSFDHGTTWVTYKQGSWNTVNLTDKQTLSNAAMSQFNLDQLTKTNFENKGDSFKLAYYLDESVHGTDTLQVDNISVTAKSPIDDVKFDQLAFYLLNTTATINVTLEGNKITGVVDDADKSKVQYRIILNDQPYYPVNGDFSSLQSSPVNIQINLSENAILFGQENVLRVEFQDSWGKTDSWETTFIGTYSGIMFKDEDGNFYSNSVGDILKRLDFGDVIAGQATLEQKVIVKNQLGYQVQNLLLEVKKDLLPQGVHIEISRSNFPFTPEDPLLFNMFFDPEQEFIFYVRMVTDSTATPAPNGIFEIRATADRV